MLTYGDHYMTSQIIVENHLAGCFEYFECQQMTPMAQLYSWQITKVCLQTIKNSMIEYFERKYMNLVSLVLRCFLF